MGWKGAVFGGLLGKVFGGPLGAILGAAIGHHLENEGRKRIRSPRRNAGPGVASSSDREMVFLASAAAMFAKMAKADGAVTEDEIQGIERAFRRLGFSAAARRYAIDVFRRAKDDSHTIYDYAFEFAAAVPSLEVRELFYELLWDIACADGVVSPEEETILRMVPRALGIGQQWYRLFANERFTQRRTSSRRPAPPKNPLVAAYLELGVKADATDAELKQAYREKAKKCHPDMLRAQGLPEEMIGKATEKMKRLNAAWAEIKEARNL